jgi:hypothetical protein
MCEDRYPKWEQKFDEVLVLVICVVFVAVIILAATGVL